MESDSFNSLWNFWFWFCVCYIGLCPRKMLSFIRFLGISVVKTLLLLLPMIQHFSGKRVLIIFFRKEPFPMLSPLIGMGLTSPTGGPGDWNRLTR